MPDRRPRARARPSVRPGARGAPSRASGVRYGTDDRSPWTALPRGRQRVQPGNEPQDRAFAAACGERAGTCRRDGRRPPRPGGGGAARGRWFAIAWPGDDRAADADVARRRRRRPPLRRLPRWAAPTCAAATRGSSSPRCETSRLGCRRRRVARGRGAGRLIGRCHGARGVDAAEGPHARRPRAALRRGPGPRAGVAVIPHWDEFGATWLPSAIAARPRPDVVLLGLDTCTAAAWDGRAWHALGPGERDGHRAGRGARRVPGRGTDRGPAAATLSCPRTLHGMRTVHATATEGQPDGLRGALGARHGDGRRTPPPSPAVACSSSTVAGGDAGPRAAKPLQTRR